MKRELLVQLHAQFEEMVQRDEESGVEFWLARDLQQVLGYRNWENFFKVVAKAITACEQSGYEKKDHFLDIRKMVNIGSGAQREVEDIMLTRYACYLIAQNGDPTKAPIAFAQTYFAVQTRKQEVIERRLAEVERLSARKKLTHSEKELSGIIFERLGEGQSFARIRSRGDMALFGGKTTEEMKGRLGIPKGRALADFLPTITIKAKDFANEITNFNIKRDDLRTEARISHEHVKNNQDVRQLLLNRDIVPERLPPAEDVKKIERRLVTEQKKLPGRVERLEGHDEEGA
ncbi:MAG: DNA damage-inducible protein D [Candidatus Hydrogenedentes bacterium]|nr:DNA damage-inducible protein D [Candidatus Hydrogenedentota bacterium]